MTNDDRATKENAREFARRVIENEFGQTVDDETLDSVADKILKVLPDTRKEPQLA